LCGAENFVTNLKVTMGMGHIKDRNIDEKVRVCGLSHSGTGLRRVADTFYHDKYRVIPRLTSDPDNEFFG
jgi:hypothetical protein